MKNAPAPRQLSFQSRLERIATTANYFALFVPADITRALQTRGPVPVSARLNEAITFPVSLAPFGGGRHILRVNAKARIAAEIKEGDPVRVQITVLDRSTIPHDLLGALRAAGAVEGFRALSIGKQNYLIKWIDEAAKPETRERRVLAAVEAAHRKRGKRMDRPS